MLILCFISHFADAFIPDGLVQSMKLNIQNHLKLLGFICNVKQANVVMRLFFPLNKWFFCPFYNAMYNFFKKTEIQRTIKADIQVIDNDPQPLLLVFFFPCMSVK